MPAAPFLLPSMAMVSMDTNMAEVAFERKLRFGTTVSTTHRSRDIKGMGKTRQFPPRLDCAVLNLVPLVAWQTVVVVAQSHVPKEEKRG